MLNIPPPVPLKPVRGDRREMEIDRARRMFAIGALSVEELEEYVDAALHDRLHPRMNHGSQVFA